MRSQVALSVLLCAASAHATEPAGAADDPVDLSVTSTSSVIFNADNRNSRVADVPSRVDDDWMLAYGRIHSRLGWRRWAFNLRLDGTWFPIAPSADAVALDLTRERAGVDSNDQLTEENEAFFLLKRQETAQQLNTRFANTVYPAKYGFSYISQNLEADVGDFYAQFGRGLVLRVRKLDELSNDTTIRGGRFTGRITEGASTFSGTVVAGSSNPLRVDEPSGRLLSTGIEQRESWRAVTEAGMLGPLSREGVQAPSTFSPDAIFGGQMLADFRWLILGVQGSWVQRQEPLMLDFVRAAPTIRTGSASMEVPNLLDRASVYSEFAGQVLEARTDVPKHTGTAAYVNFHLDFDPLGVTFEGRSYRGFYPLRGNVDITSAPEFSTVQYSAPPTAESIWNDTQFEEFNTCVTGGRLQTEYRLGRHISVSGWLGRHDTWAEQGANERCETSIDRKNEVWDAAVGTDIFGKRARSRTEVTTGVRLDQLAEQPTAASDQSDIFYRETYVRYEATQWLGGSVSLELQGWHRRRHQLVGGPEEPWFWGQTLQSLVWAGVGSVGFGFEYDTNPAVPDTYFNGEIRYVINEASSVSLFGGQRLGGLRCTSGVCRFFPPFSGVRVDAVLRF